MNKVTFREISSDGDFQKTWDNILEIYLKDSTTEDVVYAFKRSLNGTHSNRRKELIVSIFIVERVSPSLS